MPLQKKHTLNLFSLIMIAIVSVDSLRNLPIGAQYGFSLVSFYLVAAVTFFFPVAWIAGKLATRYPTTGGSYVWIEAAFGKTAGYISIWLQWVYNIIWYPTIFAFINATFGSLIVPGLEHNRGFILLTSLAAFWLITYLHCYGVRTVRWISTAGAIIGTLLPMFLMIGLAIYWLWSGSPSATPFSWQALLPTEHSFKNIAFFTNILFSLLGLEVIAMHAGNVTQPTKTFPRALTISAILILLTLMGSSLALCIIVPANQIGLISGLIDLFNVFFTVHPFPLGPTLISACIIIGGLAIASSWMVGLARGLHVALSSQSTHSWLHKLNKNHMPARVLFFQAIVYSILLSLFLLFPNINSSYWILSALTAQFALLYYAILFSAAIKLLAKTSINYLSRFLNVFLPAMGITICLCGIIIGFLPPDEIVAQDAVKYIIFMALGFVLLSSLPALFLKRR